MTYSLAALAEFSATLSSLYAANSPQAAVERLLPHLSRLFRSNHIFVDEQSPDGRVPVVHTKLGDFGESAVRYPALVHEHPPMPLLLKGPMPAVYRISALTSDRRFQNTGFYQEILRPFSERERMGLTVQLSSSVLAITVHRDSAFTDDETFMLEQLQPHLAAVTEQGRLMLRQRTTSLDEAAYEAAVGDDGVVRAIGESFAALLTRYYPGEIVTASRPPQKVAAWVRAQSDLLRSLAVTSPCDSLCSVRTPGGTLRLQLTPDGNGPGFILRGAEEKHAADYYRLTTFGLTARECEVVFWISQGKRDAEIATILGIAVKTAGKHVENLLAKLHAENRASAANTAREWLAGDRPVSSQARRVLRAR